METRPKQVKVRLNNHDYMVSPLLARDLSIELQQRFADHFNGMCVRIHAIAVEKGWWTSQPRNIAEILLNIHCEISEAAEVARDDITKSDEKIAGYSAFEIELADAVIRIMDLAQAMELDLARAIEAKTAYNRNRPFRHGGKQF